MTKYYRVLIRISSGYSPVIGRLHTCYAPVRRFPFSASTKLLPRLACIRPAASVHPEPGSNSPLFYELLAPKSKTPERAMCLNLTTIFIPKRISDGAFYYLFKHSFQRTFSLTINTLQNPIRVLPL